MYATYGGYPLDANAAIVGIATLHIIDDNKLPYAVEQTVTVRGSIQGCVSQYQLTARRIQLQQALSIPRRDLCFRHDDGSLTPTSLIDATSLTGVRLVAGPDFAAEGPGEYATVLTYTFSMTATYALPYASPRRILSWNETISFSGGGPVYIMKSSIYGPPQRQKIQDQSPFTAVQSGSAVGWLEPPPIPPPVFGIENLTQSGDGSASTPQIDGVIRERWPATWSYSFASAYPLFGIPTFKPGF